MSDLRPPISAEGWSLVLRPKTGWLDLHLSDLWRYRDLTMLFVWRDFVAQYKQTILGPLWHLLQPLFTTLLFTLIFGRIAKLPTDSLPPMLFYMAGTFAYQSVQWSTPLWPQFLVRFYMAGVTCWNYFAECLNRTSTTFIQNAGIFGKVYFPRLCVPVSVVISNLIKFGIQFALFLGFVAWYWRQGAPIHPNLCILLAPVLLLLMAGLGLGSGIIISALTTRYRDLQVLVTFGVQLAMFATPVIYPLSMVSAKYRWVMLANPMTPIVEIFRYSFLGAGSFDPLYLAWSAGATLITLAIGIVLFNHVERTFMDTV